MNMTIIHNTMTASIIMEISLMINENTTFKQYLKESGYSLMQYQEEVYHTCLAKSSKYKNIDLYFQDEIEQGFNDDASIEDTANTICEKFDDFFDKTNVEEEDEEYTPEQLQAFADYPQDSFDEDVNESTETETKDDGMTDGETYTQWKENVFKYLDKRIETDKIKELGTYIKDFIKQEYDNGEPSWFNVAESVVNYARTNYPQAVKPRESNAFSITESVDGPATFTNELVNQFVRYVKKWFTSNTKYRVLMSDSVTKDGEHPYTHEKKKTYELTLRNAPVQTSLYLVVYSDYCYIAADGDRFSTKSYKFTSIQSLDKALNMLYDNIESVYGSLDEAFIQDDRDNVSITDTLGT